MCITNQMDCGSTTSNDHQQPPFQAKQQIFVNSKLNLELNENILKVLKVVYDHKDAWAFRAAVDEQYAPNYYHFITEPMDLSKMIERAQCHEYSSVEQVQQDFVQMVRNCEQYNGGNSPYTQYAHHLWRSFVKNARTHLNVNLNVDEQKVFRYAPLPPAMRNRKRLARLLRQKSQSQALETLYNATKQSIESTFARNPLVVNTTGSPLVHSDHVQDAQHLQEMIRLAGQSDENLIFKRLNDWHNEIVNSGSCVILPEEAVQVIESPISTNWITNYPEEQQHLKYSTLLFGRLTHQLSRGRSKTIDKPQQQESNESELQSKDMTTSDSERLHTTAPVRLVIKLCRKNNDWKSNVNNKRKFATSNEYYEEEQDEDDGEDDDNTNDSEDFDCDREREESMNEQNEQRHFHGNHNEMEMNKMKSNECSVSRKRNCRMENNITSGLLYEAERSFSNEHLISLYQ